MFQPPEYLIEEKVWVWQGKGVWHFVTIPKEISEEIKKMFGYLSAQWGSLPVTLTVGKTTWKTSLFPDTKSECYFIPIKAEIRKKEGIKEGGIIQISIQILV